MGPGVLTVFGYSLYFFVKYIKRSFMHQKALGKALMTSAICFAYGCFSFIYVMYYLFKLPDSPYIFAVYFTITIIYCSLLTAGIVIESKRKRKLEELLVTRKELLSFFGDQKKPAVSNETPGQWKFNQ
jgi:cation transport ATPase